MIVDVGQSNIAAAAAIHSASWTDSHRSFCSMDFVALHTPQHQLEYLQYKLNAGSRIFLLIDAVPAGIVSVSGNLIEDLYVLPKLQNRGYGTTLLRFAIGQCDDTPTLWILENNVNAERLYARMGFRRQAGSTVSRTS